MQKKENKKYLEEIEEFEKLIKEKKQDEEQIDLNQYNSDGENQMNQPPQSKLMQTRLQSQGRVGASASKLRINGAQTEYTNQSPLRVDGSSKVESEEQKILRYERVIDQLQKMIDAVKKQNKSTRMQFEKEISSKTQLEYYLKKAVKKVINERKKSKD